MEILVQRSIRVEGARSEERIAGHIPECAGCRPGPRSASAAVEVQLRGWRRGGGTTRSRSPNWRGRVPLLDARIIKSRFADQVGTARAGVFVSSAIQVGRRKWNTGFV